MKILGTFLLFCIVAVVNGQKPDPFFHQKISGFDAAKAFNSKIVMENISYSDYDLVYQKMQWSIDPSVNYISGSVTSRIKSLKEGLGSIEFDLHNDFDVDSIKVKNELLSFTHIDHVIKIQLLKTLEIGEIDSLSIFYKGVPNKSGFGSFIQSTHNQTPIIWTLSEPYGALEWWPCKQSLSDKIDSIDIIVTSPEPYRTASIGTLVSEEVKDNKRIMHWKSRYPIATYLVAIAVTNYVDYSDFVPLENGDSIEILNYVYPENLVYAKENTPQTIEIMQLYNRLFGVYPFASEKYGHAQFGWGGGMEHQTMSFMGSFSFNLIAHELAHQWFGDYVTLSSWHDIWLNEGFATFLTGLSKENLLAEEDWDLWKTQVLASIVSQDGGSVYVEDTTSVPRIFNGRLSYNKGAYLLHMLRWTLGDEVLFKAIRNYLSDPDIGNNFASQYEFVKYLELEADTSLTEFFEDWYYGEGYPNYTIEYQQHENLDVDLVIHQKSSHNSVSFFEMPVPIRVWNVNLSEYKDYKLQHTFDGQAFTINPGYLISKLEFDPDLWLISKNNIVTKTNILVKTDRLLVFPNPTSGNIRLILTGSSMIKELAIFNNIGQNVYAESYLPNLVKLSLPNLKKGSYIVKVTTIDMKNYQQQIIIH